MMLILRREQGEIVRYAHLALATTTPATPACTPTTAC